MDGVYDRAHESMTSLNSSDCILKVTPENKQVKKNVPLICFLLFSHRKSPNNNESSTDMEITPTINPVKF